MKYLIFISFMFLALPLFAKEECGLKDLDLEKSSVVEKLFYIGTCHYRNKDYEKAAKSWKELSKLDVQDQEFQGLQIDVLNNLGFLLFFGYGVEKNQLEAVGYWKQAILLGHTESEYHLCHAYADVDEPTYNKAKAKKHCAKALLIYKGMEEKDKEILRQIRIYNQQVNG